MKKAKAFAPGNISCVFGIYEHKNPCLAGSFGFGFTINMGVTAEVALSDQTQIFFNKKLLNISPVAKIISTLTEEKVMINLSSPLPLGAGFGLSGAGALAVSYALNKLLALKKSPKQLAVFAHIAEVESKTGLGDVTNQYFGGFLVKLRPSSRFLVERLPFNNTPVYYANFGKLQTASVLTDKKLKDEINNSAKVALSKMKDLILKKEMQFADIIKLSKEFSENSGLLTDKKVIDTIKTVEQNNGAASMIMLGNAVFSNIPSSGAKKLFISDTPAHVL